MWDGAGYRELGAPRSRVQVFGVRLTAHRPWPGGAQEELGFRHIFGILLRAPQFEANPDFLQAEANHPNQAGECVGAAQIRLMCGRTSSSSLFKSTTPASADPARGVSAPWRAQAREGGRDG